jgi:pimeloyl-ACP methyl ester carboxylesterase
MTTIRSDGVDLYVKEAGAGEPVLLIHGTGINADTWSPVFEDLAADYHALSYTAAEPTAALIRDAARAADPSRAA